MSDKVFVGEHAADLDIGEKATKITRVNILVDEEHQYTAGDDTGRTLEKTVPWGSQAMAESILAAVRGYDYQPFVGTDALINPAAEIGDGVTVGGVYSVLAQKDIAFGKLTTTEISAPSTDEIEDEYPYQSRQLRQQQRQVAQTRSMIVKSADAITQLVEAVDGRVTEVVTDVTGIHTTITAIDGRVLEVETTVDGITVTGKDGKTYVGPGAIETGSLNADKITSHTITAEQIQAKSITTSELSFTVYDQAQTDSQIDARISALKDGLELTVENNEKGTAATLRLMDGTIELDAANINLTGLVTIDALQTSGGGVEINGDNIKAGHVNGQYIDAKNLNIANKFIVDSSGNITIKNCDITLQDSSVKNNMIQDGAVGSDELASNSVTSGKIAAKAVTASKINALGLSIGPEGKPAQFRVDDKGNVFIAGDVSISGSISWSNVTGTEGLTSDINTAKSDASTAKTNASTANTDLEALAKGTYTKAGVAGDTFISGKVISSAEIRGADFKNLDGTGLFKVQTYNDFVTFIIGTDTGTRFFVRGESDGGSISCNGFSLTGYKYSGSFKINNKEMISYNGYDGDVVKAGPSGGTWDFSNVTTKGLYATFG